MMKLLVFENFDGAGMGVFPTFPKGTTFEFVGKDDESQHWCPCISEAGHGFWTPDIYLDGKVLTCDYNPTSLTVKAGQMVTLKAVVFEWFYVMDEQGTEGWLPAKILVTSSELEEERNK